MLQPVTPTWVMLLLLMVTVAEAQPRALRSRRVTGAAHPGEPLPEVRVAAGHKTSILLGAPVDKESVQLDETCFRLVDMGCAPSSLKRW